MTPQRPRVSVLMAVHNGGRYLRQAVESILAQTFQDFEFLIVDDGSSDNTPGVIGSYADRRIRLVQNSSNLGLTKSLNLGLSLARAPLIARQDSDDISRPTRLAQQVDFMDRHPDVALVGARVRTIDGEGRTVSRMAWPLALSEIGVRWQLLFDSPFVHTAVVFRRDVVWGELGGYNERFVTSQDYELWSRLAMRHRTCNLLQVLVDFRTHGGSVSARYAKEDIDRVREPLHANLQRYLRLDDPPAGWLDLWIAVNNPSVYGRARLAALVEFVDAFRARFVKLYPESHASTEISAHIAAMFVRVACAHIGAQPLQCIRLLRRALAIDTATALAAVIDRMGGRLSRYCASRSQWRCVLARGR